VLLRWNIQAREINLYLSQATYATLQSMVASKFPSTLSAAICNTTKSPYSIIWELWDMEHIHITPLTSLHNCGHNLLMPGPKCEVHSVLQNFHTNPYCCWWNLQHITILWHVNVNHYKKPISNNKWDRQTKLNFNESFRLNLTLINWTQTTDQTSFTIHYLAHCQQHLPVCRLHHTGFADSVAAGTTIHHTTFRKLDSHSSLMKLPPTKCQGMVFNKQKKRI
jgi:hypothetical protein